jgi:hypothetical protein
MRSIIFGILGLLIILCQPLRAGMLLSDDFEQGISKAWLQTSKDIQIVPEDPANPNGNKVARLKSGMRLVGPPVLPRDVKAAEKQRDALGHWKNYEFRFRFRLGNPLKVNEGSGSRTPALMNVAWRINPNADNPGESQMLYVQVWKQALAPYPWRIYGPLVPWFGKNEEFQHQDEGGKLPPAADTLWHTLTVCVLDEETRIFFDEKLFFRGSDDRVMQGGVAINTVWSEQVELSHIDIDDVTVRTLEPPPKSLNAQAARVSTAPVLDGKLDDACWKTAEPLQGWVTLGKSGKPVKLKRQAYVAYDDTNLYVAMRAKIEDPELLESLSDRPEAGDTLRVDVTGAATGIDCNGKNIGVILPYLLPVQGKAMINKTDWCAEMTVPWTHLGGKPAPKQPIAFNVNGHDYEDGFVTWAPVEDPRDLKNFGKLILLP